MFILNNLKCLESIDTLIKNRKYSTECNNTLFVKNSDNFVIDLNIVLLQLEMILGIEQKVGVIFYYSRLHFI
jgi:hypothetical protein